MQFHHHPTVPTTLARLSTTTALAVCLAVSGGASAFSQEADTRSGAAAGAGKTATDANNTATDPSVSEAVNETGSSDDTGSGDPGSTAASASSAASPPVVTLTDWTYDDLYANGWSLDEVMDEAAVVGTSGEEIGDVENVLIGEDGKILAVIAEIGGLWDIGDTHVSVPWDEVELADDLERITVPVSEDNVGDYSLFGERSFYIAADASMTQEVDDDLATGPTVWKATDLLDDYALLSGRDSYGYVRDLIFDSEGLLTAVVVNADTLYGGSTYAYPYQGYGSTWSPADPYYSLPYDRDETAVIKTFDYDEIQQSAASSSSADKAGDENEAG